MSPHSRSLAAAADAAKARLSVKSIDSFNRALTAERQIFVNSVGIIGAFKVVMVRALITIICIYGFVQTAAFADPSVWEKATIEANSVVGKVVSIATDDEKILVRISDGHTTETYKVCTILPGGDFTLAESERVKSLREAFSHGDIVRVSYNSVFDRCLRTVEVSHEKEESPKDKEAAKSKTNQVSQK